jgi:protein-S-isoprenylcysteine O-methyltransferase Ste14
MSNLPAYGHWQLVIFNSLFMLVFVFAFFKPTTRRDWRTFGTFSAFVVALFTEMYGFPLTIYLLSGWLGSRFPEINWFSHNSSHLLQTLLGWEGDAHAGPLHLLSNVLIVGGLFYLAASWRVLYRAQKNGTMASSGPYAKVRHPQYTAFMVIMIGFLIQWPTLPTLVMFPFLTLTYYRLARREERVSLEAFGESYARYMKNTPRFLPKLGNVSAQEADTL